MDARRAGRDYVNDLTVEDLIRMNLTGSSSRFGGGHTGFGGDSAGFDGGSTRF